MKNIAYILSLLALCLCSCSKLQHEVRLVPDEIAVNTLSLNEDEAKISVDFDVINSSDTQPTISAEVEILCDGHKIESKSQDIAVTDTTAMSFTFEIANPELTTDDSRTDYQARITLKDGWSVLDECDKTFDLRAREFIACARPRLQFMSGADH